MADRRDLSYRERRRLASEIADEMESREREARRRQERAEEKARKAAEKERAAQEKARRKAAEKAAKDARERAARAAVGERVDGPAPGGARPTGGARPVGGGAVQVQDGSRVGVPAAAPAVAPAGGLLTLRQVLQAAGVGDLASCQTLVGEGRVTVDGRPVLDAMLVLSPTQAVVRVDGVVVRPDQPAISIGMLHKPYGVACTVPSSPDAPGLDTLLRGGGIGLLPVGWVQPETEGLVLVTGNLELADHLARAGDGLPSTFVTTLTALPSQAALDGLRNGLAIPAPVPAGPADGPPPTWVVAARDVQLVQTADGAVALSLTTFDTSDTTVRQLLHAAGLVPQRVVRTGLGPLRLDGLDAGQSRALTWQEQLMTISQGGRR